MHWRGTRLAFRTRAEWVSRKETVQDRLECGGGVCGPQTHGTGDWASTSVGHWSWGQGAAASPGPGGVSSRYFQSLGRVVGQTWSLPRESFSFVSLTLLRTQTSVHVTSLHKTHADTRGFGFSLRPPQPSLLVLLWTPCRRIGVCGLRSCFRSNRGEGTSKHLHLYMRPCESCNKAKPKTKAVLAEK